MPESYDPNDELDWVCGHDRMELLVGGGHKDWFCPECGSLWCADGEDIHKLGSR